LSTRAAPASDHRSAAARIEKPSGKQKDGRFTLVRHTIATRRRAKLVEIKEMLNRMRHLPVPEEGRWLGQVMRGYVAYHGTLDPSRSAC
jgi:RNA-directed DNA polymerase